MEQPFYRRHPAFFFSAFFAFLVFLLLLFTDRIIGFMENKAKEKLEAGKDHDLISIDGPINRIIRFRDSSPNKHGFVQPTQDYIQGTDNLELKKYDYNTDSLGFIMPSKVYSNPDLEIVFMGGSTTECLFIDQNFRFPSLSAQLLSEKTHLKVNGYNNGFSGNNSMSISNLLVNKIIPLQPDYVVFMENVNDLNTLLYEGTYWNRNITRSLTLDSALIHEYNRYFPPATNIEPSKSISDRLFPHLKNRWYRLLAILRNGKNPTNPKSEWEKTSQQLTIDSIKICQNYKSSLVSFVKTAKAWNIQLVLMTQQNRFTANPDPKILAAMKPLIDKGISYEQYCRLYTAFQNILRQTAAEENLPCIDLEKQIPPTKEYIYDSVHLNKKGSMLAAEIIANQFLTIIKTN